MVIIVIFSTDYMSFKLTKLSKIYLWKAFSKYLELYCMTNLIDVDEYLEIDIDII